MTIAGPSPDDFDRMSDREWSVRACERAVHAISAAGSVGDRLNVALDRIDALEAGQRRLMDVLEAVLGMVEDRG